MINWKTLKKIDVHIHILPDEVHQANPNSEDVWLFTDLHQYAAMMDNLGIKKAVIMPLNDPWLMSMEFTIDAVHSFKIKYNPQNPEENTRKLEPSKSYLVSGSVFSAFGLLMVILTVVLIKKGKSLIK